MPGQSQRRTVDINVEDVYINGYLNISNELAYQPQDTKVKESNTISNMKSMEGMDNIPF